MNIMDGKESSTLSPADMAKVVMADPQEKKPDVKVTEPVSSADSKVDEKKEPEKVAEDPEKLKSEIEGLKAELARVRKSRGDSSDKIEHLEKQIKDLQDASKATPQQKFTDDELVDIKVEWTDLLAEARADLRDARKDGNQEAITQAEAKVAKAKGQINLAEKEIFKRTQEAGLKRIEQASEEQTVMDDIAGMYAEMSKAYPDLAKDGTPLHEAAAKELRSMNPGLRKRLGAMDELVAGQRAIAKNPDLIKSETRKTLLADIEAAAAVKTSPKAAPTAPARSTGTVDYSKMSAADMESMIQRIVSGA